ncbi:MULTISPECIES: ABC transporter permease [unclassified Vibrio]|uniref:ABC transporter permease n=1 Tax=unclassified Vibrio TaxID=2614977 RepID=UPI000B8E5133|nr:MULTISPECIES: ABC transporter permease [unclassified Vibrio]NAX17783.1 FtsX-like permease family protein [Vibrio sp. V22_P2S10T140]OXX45011.1 peptide ABC transporter permease [Vibrio sp. V07_P2A8T137]OXX56057.1 peptide ABC transporter permease [Vibrio sp. V10_P2A27P122]PSD42649.1 ABC transporter permease [Vibrio sp. V02_P2A34T13]
MMLPIRQIYQEMAAEKLRLLLTILAVAWGTLCIATMLATGEGLRQGLTRSSQSGNGNLLYVTGGYASQTAGRFFEGKALSLQADDVELVRALPFIQRAEVSAQWDKRVSNQDNGTWQRPLAVNPEYQSLTGIEIAKGGRWINPLDNQQQRKVVVLGYNAAVQLFNSEDGWSWLEPQTLSINPVGQLIKIGDENFTVIGVIAQTSAEVEQGTPIDYAVFVPFRTWQRFNPNAAIAAINVQLNATVDREKAAQVIKQVIARKYGASASDTQLLQVEDMLLRQKSMRRFLFGLQGFLGIIGLITLGVAGIGIANVMYATVKRSTRDIGVRMAVGATPTTIKLHYLVQALLTMSLGGLAGLGSTYGLITLLRYAPLEGSMLFEQLGKPLPELSFSIVFLVIAALAIVGVIAAWFPANRAASITPLEALQSE